MVKMLGMGQVNRKNLLPVILAITVASVLIFSLSGNAFAAGTMQGDRGSIKGEVVAVNQVHNAQTLTLRSSQIGQFPNDQMNIFMNKDTKVRVCNVREPYKDIHIDHSAVVKYHERGGVAVANSVMERC